MNGIEKRRAARREPREPIDVSDHISGNVIGFIGNLSTTGMMLIAHQAIREGTLHQMEFSLPGADGKPCLLSAGVQAMWTSSAATIGKHWAGLRFVALGDDDTRVLQNWLARPEVAV